MMESVASGNRVLNDTTVKQVSDSVKKLIDAKNVVAGVSSFSQSPALAEIAAQLMEPKIDKWFNENLSELVEKIVREEIKKLIPKE
jgi:cell pole-organizing protein PopZ